jgi:hypothetical protein
MSVRDDERQRPGSHEGHAGENDRPPAKALRGYRENEQDGDKRMSSPAQLHMDGSRACSSKAAT